MSKTWGMGRCNSYNILLDNLKGRDGTPKCKYDNIKIELKILDLRVWTRFNWLCLGPSSCEHNDESPGFIEFMRLLDQLSDYHLLNKNSSPRS
jgi:hypothetical protein